MNRFPWISVCALVLAAVPALAKGPGVVKFDEVSFEAAEGTTAVIRVERSGGEDGAVSVQYATGGGTATAGQDYTAASGTLSWAAGEEGTKTFAVPVLADAAAEGEETVQLTLSNPGGGVAIDATRGTSVLRILANGGGGGGGGGDDHGGAGVLKFDQSDFQVIEGNRTAVITVERSGGENGAVSVQYATADGTAKAGQDYQAASGTLAWADGDESRKSFTVQILDDTTAESAETVRLTLSNPAGGAGLDAERSQGVLTILDSSSGSGSDDNGNGGGTAGTLRFDEAGFQVLEGAGVARVVVERSHGGRGTVSVRYATADGSAHAGEDYTAVSGVLTWAAGDERPKVIEVPVLDDSAAEGNETVRLTLSDPAGGAALDAGRKTATLTILDDDGSTTACVDDDDTLCLLDDRFQVEVVWRTPQGTIGAGHGAHLSSKTGTFWFFNADNVEMLIKVLDACQLSGTSWVFFAATTDVDFTVTVTDTRTGVVKQYTNPAGRAAAPVQDTLTFPCSR